MKNYILRSGGLTPSFYVKDSVYTCHQDEATKFTKEEANAIINRLEQAEKVNGWGTSTLRAKLIA